MELTIKTTKIYERSIAKLLSEQQRIDLENKIAVDPFDWPVIHGTGGVRKARFARDGMGKSGGGRICYLYLSVHEVIYFLLAYPKNDKEDISDQDKKKMRKLVQQILET